MTDQEKLECYELVNSSETFEQLKEAINKIGEKNRGLVKGRKKSFSSSKLTKAVNLIKNQGYSLNYLTRSFGIRQQMIYLLTYGEQ